MVVMFLQASFASNKISGNADACIKQVIKTYLKDTLRTLGWNTYMQSSPCRATRVVTDFFMASMRDGFIHLLFLSTGRPMMTDFSTLVFVTDLLVAQERVPGVRLGATGSQNCNGTKHWFKRVVKTDASCQSPDIHNTMNNPNAGITPGPNHGVISAL